MRPMSDPAPTEVRTYQLRNGSLDVPNLLRVLANELETADQDCIDKRHAWHLPVRHLGTGPWGRGYPAGGCPGTRPRIRPKGEGMNGYDSAADTLRHIVRVCELLVTVAADIAQRGPAHDASKLVDPEKATFDEYTPKLKTSTYGSEEYQGFLAGMRAGLDHHYAHNRHHPEHFDAGIDGMTLVDLIEMLADWKAATERHADGDLARSLCIQQERFGISDQLVRVLENTGRRYGWLPTEAAA
jgi:hypothetical protein